MLAEDRRFLGRMTNNEAEYRALLMGLTKAQTLKKGGELVVLMDSELVVSQLIGTYKTKAPHLRQLLMKVKIQERAFSKVIYKLVPRGKNTHADTLANQVLDTVRRQ